MISLLAASHAAAKECPVKNAGPEYLETVAKLIDGKSCSEANNLALACALGASGDRVIVGAAITVCKKSFAKHKEDTALFTKLVKRCAATYAKRDGTMAISEAAFCELSAATFFNQLNTPE